MCVDTSARAVGRREASRDAPRAGCMALRSRLASAAAAEPAGRGVCHPRPAGPRAAPLARRVDVRAGLAVPLPADRNQRLAEGLRRTPGVLNEALTRLSSSLERKECPTVQTVRHLDALDARGTEAAAIGGAPGEPSVKERVVDLLRCIPLQSSRPS